ncbi:MAG: hypothetical protein K5656_09020 [Lachnospiraceae bacterium]|nr:hypothetical protein [Lachnospiraceae bacterium]
MELSEEMKRFLVYSVFGDVLESRDKLEEKEYNEYLVKKCIKLAYLDLCRVIPYRISSSELEKKNNKDYIYLKERFYFDVEKLLFSEINNASCPVLIINKVVKKAKEYYSQELFDLKLEFTYGMAQKWVNMTLKYLWLFGECPLNDDDLDVPIDSYILDMVWETKNIRGRLEKRFKANSKLFSKGKKLDWKKDYKRPSDSIVKWSLMEKKTYLYIQEAIKEYCNDNNLSPMKWENDAWIKRVVLCQEKDQIKMRDFAC